MASFITLTTTAYFLAIFPYLLSGRSNMPKGPFYMEGITGYIVNIVTCVLILFFNVWFCWPYAYPVTLSLMNWNSLIFGCILVLITFWWFVHGAKRYPGPKLAGLYLEGVEQSN